MGLGLLVGLGTGQIQEMLQNQTRMFLCPVGASAQQLEPVSSLEQFELSSPIACLTISVILCQPHSLQGVTLLTSDVTTL